MNEMGFDTGKASPWVFHHKESDIRAVVHGDDFALLGSRKQLDWFKGRVESKFEIKYKGRFENREKDINSVRILNRIVTLTPD